MDNRSENRRHRGFATALARSAKSGLDLRRIALRQLLPFGLTLGLLFLLWQRVDGLDVAYIYTSLKTVTLPQWCGAAVFSAISFWALGRYDGVVHRLIGTGVSTDAAERAGITAMGASSGQSLLVLSDPLSRKFSQTSLLRSLSALANRNFLTPFLYKAGGRWAVAARQAGWQVFPIAREGWVDPTRFSVSGSNKRQLRRKLRQADKEGIEISEAGANLPLSQMQKIADEWRCLRGSERGFSMGQWHPDHLPHARVYLARKNENVIGFLTLHENASEQALDLMRLGSDAPDGTMHALLTFAISQAGRDGCTRLSLAALPLEGQGATPWVYHRARLKLDKITGAAGLRQFKGAFAPRWETLYVAAPTGISLILGALDVTREICRKSRAGGASKPHSRRCQAASVKTS